MAFNHNDGGDGKLKAGKAAGGRSTKKKTAGRKMAGSGEDAAKSAVSGTRAPSAKKAPARRAVSGGRPKRERSAGSSAGPGAELVEMDPFEVAKQTMKGSVPAIVEEMVKRAKRGSCTHAKTLLEMTGAKRMFGDEPEMRDAGEPWAKLVLKRMEEAEQESLPKTAGKAEK